MSKKKKEDKVEEPKKGKKPKAEKSAKAAKPAKATKPAKSKTAKTVAISDGDIALRAYYIGESRQRRGEHGDPHGDWVEAERQLREEAAKKK